MNNHTRIIIWTLLLLCVACIAGAQTPPPSQQKPPAAQPPATAPKTPAVAQAAGAATTQALPPDYVIGPDDVLRVDFWRDKDMSSEVTVRPDGMITLPLINDVKAGGLTPDQLREKVLELAKRYIEDPSATITVKEIRSRKVFITGEVNKGGAFLLTDRMTVLQLIATAGGLTEFAKSKNILVVRTEPSGQTRTFKFNYKEVLQGKNLKQDIELKPGDRVIVP